MNYPHLHLTRWPFPAVPEEDFCDFIADRKELRGDIDGLLSTLSRQEVSSIHVVWSWFGAGKTHTLYYFSNRARSESSDQRMIQSVYSEFPKAVRSFLDLYRSFAAGLDYNEVIDAYFEISTGPNAGQFERAVLATSPDLITALRVLATGKTPDQMIAQRWLRGDQLPPSEYRRIGIAQRINSSEEAGGILAALVKLFTLAAKSRQQSTARVLWLIDEFQRISKIPPRLLEEISTGLQSTFNAAPTGLAIVLSFSGKPEQNLPNWFIAGLRDRIDRTKVLVLPPMLPEEAIAFIKDVLQRFRTPDAPQRLAPCFPFTEESCRTIVEIIQRNEDLKPRSIMLAFNAVLQEAELLMERKELDTISTAFAKNALKNYVPIAVEED